MSTVETTRPLDGNGPTSQAVVTALADHKNVDPIELNPPLYDVVDPDALDSLFCSVPDGSDGRIEFRYDDCRVAIDATGDVTVTDDVDA